MVKSREGYRIAERASKSFLSARIRQSYVMKEEARKESNEIKEFLEGVLSSDDNQSTINQCSSNVGKVKEKTKRRQVKKLNELLKNKSKKKGSSIDLRPEGLKKWVVNLTEHKLTRDQEDVLKLGLNFVPAPKKLPMLDIVTGIELGARKLGSDEAEELRGRVCGILRKAELPKDNLTREQRKAIGELESLEGIAILPADKGNATVLMKSEDYDQKLSGMLASSTYGVLKIDPTATRESKLTRYLKDLEKKGELPPPLYRKLRPTGSKPPMLYGLPKIHKDEVPLRPIVACIGSPTYDLSKFLASLISPLSGGTRSYVRNSLHFVEEVKGLNLKENEIMVSFDVRSLFTNVPIAESIQVIYDRLVKDSYVSGGTNNTNS